MNERDSTDHEIELLESIHSHSDHVRQRDLARIAGLSLGMTNTIVKRLVQKGWLTIRKVNNRNIRYAVSPEGIDEISRRSYRYFKRTIRNIVFYKETIEAFVRDVKSREFEEIELVGPSDLDFVIERACELYRIPFVRDGAASGDPKRFILYSENAAAGNGAHEAQSNSALLSDILSKHAEAE